MLQPATGLGHRWYFRWKSLANPGRLSDLTVLCVSEKTSPPTLQPIFDLLVKNTIFQPRNISPVILLYFGVKSLQQDSS